MGNLKTILSRGVFLFFVTTFIISVSLISVEAVASDGFSQYGLGAEGLTLPLKQSPKLSPKRSESSENTLNYQFAKDFENDYRQYGFNQNTGNQNSFNQNTGSQKQQDLNKSVLQIDIEYEDKSADFSSPYHGTNTNLNNKFNHTSNEYQTRMGYRFKHLSSEAAFNYSPDSYGFGQYYNYELGVAVPIKDIFSLETRYGWNKFDKQSKEGGMNDYQDWSVGVSTTYKGMKLKVDYMDMNASENSQECGKSFPCEGKTVFSIIKDF